MFDKHFEITFDVDYKALALIYICYRYKFPASYFLSFYQMYGEQAMFVLKAFSCMKPVSLSDNGLLKIVEESKLLYKLIITGISIKIKRQQLEQKVKNGWTIKEPIPDEPTLDTSEFSNDYKDFIENYLLKNIIDIFNEKLTLKLDTIDLYEALR